jgi:endogenous inhibitor of DNA gyrase (YacG/DUF329 family)
MQAGNRKCNKCRKKVDAKDALISHLKAFCSYECLKEYTAQNAEKIASKVRKEKRAETRQAKEKLKTRAQWMREAQAAFNAYVRARDKDLPCISCGLNKNDNYITGSGWDAGHYRSRGASPHLRFHLWNVHKQCVKCNRYLSGNVSNFRIGMVRKIGAYRVLQLESMNHGPEMTIDYFKRIKSIFRRKAKTKV